VNKLLHSVQGLGEPYLDQPIGSGRSMFHSQVPSERLGRSEARRIGSCRRDATCQGLTLELPPLSKNYRLGFQEFLQSVNSAFPTYARLLVATEWRKRIVIQRIDEHASGLQLPRYATAPFGIG
jgi:hypothetical protein